MIKEWFMNFEIEIKGEINTKYILCKKGIKINKNIFNID